MAVLLKIAPDTEQFIVEHELLFPGIDCSIPKSIIPLFLAPHLRQANQIVQDLRKWTLIETVPTHRKFVNPCCDLIAKGLPGTPLRPKYEPSVFQGDTDDAMNFETLAKNGERYVRDGVIDWVVIQHFWQPSIVIDPDETKEFMKSLPGQGFIPLAESRNPKLREHAKKWQ